MVGKSNSNSIFSPEISNNVSVTKYPDMSLEVATTTTIDAPVKIKSPSKLKNYIKNFSFKTQANCFCGKISAFLNKIYSKYFTSKPIYYSRR